MTWTRHRLSPAESWNPQTILRPDPASLWGVPTVAFELLFTRLLPTPLSLSDVPGIRPGDIDPGSGTLRVVSQKDLPSGYEVSRQALKVGDLLVHGRAPAVLVTEQLKPFRFSSAFVALRPNQELDPLWAWLALNTTAGQEMRASLEDQQRLDSGALFRDGVLPVVPQEAWQSLRKAAEALLQRVNDGLSVVDGGQSWWRRADLWTADSWLVELLVRDPGELHAGVPLGELVGGIDRGRNSPAEPSTEPSTAAMPRFNVTQLRKGRSDEWVVPAADDVVAGFGEVLLASVGVDNLAMAVTAPCVVGSNVFRLRLRSGVSAEVLADALNSPSGRRQREIYTSGSAIPTVRRKDALRMRVQLGAEPATPTLDLTREADQLAGPWI